MLYNLIADLQNEGIVKPVFTGAMLSQHAPILD